MVMVKNRTFRYNSLMLRRTKILTAIASVLLIAVCISHGEMFLPHALAEDKVISDTQGSIMQSLLIAIGVLNFAAFLVMKLLSWLIDPGNIYALGNEGMMLRLWQISRDIMNLIFALLLLGGAIMTIVFAKQDIIKQNIVKFLLAVVLVNFSWFFPRVIIDIANVTTATVYGLPKAIDSTCQWRDGTGTLRTDCVVVNDILLLDDASGACPTATGGSEVDFAPIMKVCLAPLDSTANTGFGIINGLVVNHGRLMHLGLIVGSPPSGGTGGSVAETLRFIIIISFVTFLHVMLVFPLAAMTAVMIIRIPILWMTISFMPFMFIGFLIGDKFIKINTMEIFQKHFMTAAFLPTLIAIPISIGYIMLNQVATLSSAPPGLGGSFKLITEVQNWWGLIWILLSFMVIWIGSFWAMKSDSIYAKFSEPIHSIGNNFLKLPLNTPFIPHDTNGNGTKNDPGDRIGAKTFFRNLQSESAFGNAIGLGGKPKGGGTGVTAQAPELLGALNKINGAAKGDAAVDRDIKLLDQHLNDRGIRIKDQAAVRSELPAILAELKKANPGANTSNLNLDDLADKIANAQRKP